LSASISAADLVHQHSTYPPAELTGNITRQIALKVQEVTGDVIEASNAAAAASYAADSMCTAVISAGQFL